MRLLCRWIWRLNYSGQICSAYSRSLRKTTEPSESIRGTVSVNNAASFSLLASKEKDAALLTDTVPLMDSEGSVVFRKLREYAEQICPE